MKPIRVGGRVRTADAAGLLAALLSPLGSRPEPGQMVCAGRETTVTGYRRNAENRATYALRDVPGFWPEEWIDAI